MVLDRIAKQATVVTGVIATGWTTYGGLRAWNGSVYEQRNTILDLHDRLIEAQEKLQVLKKAKSKKNPLLNNAILFIADPNVAVSDSQDIIISNAQNLIISNAQNVIDKELRLAVENIEHIRAHLIETEGALKRNIFGRKPFNAGSSTAKLLTYSLNLRKSVEDGKLSSAAYAKLETQGWPKLDFDDRISFRRSNLKVR